MPGQLEQPFHQSGQLGLGPRCARKLKKKAAPLEDMAINVGWRSSGLRRGEIAAVWGRVYARAWDSAGLTGYLLLAPGASRWRISGGCITTVGIGSSSSPVVFYPSCCPGAQTNPGHLDIESSNMADLGRLQPSGPALSVKAQQSTNFATGWHFVAHCVLAPSPRPWSGLGHSFRNSS
jgi:hypothetical protein